MVSPGSSDDGASAAAAAAVCCMCGDQGLPGELFQCAACLQRLQHRYCSDQYPNMAAYSICNWCLRGKEVGGGSRSPSSPAAAKALTARAKQRAAASTSRLNGSRGQHDDKDRPCNGGSGGCSRSAFPAEEPQKPVKKPKKKNQERTARRPVAAPAPAAKETEVQTGGAMTKPPVRAKARVPRYKLLTEVIITDQMQIDKVNEERSCTPYVKV